MPGGIVAFWPDMSGLISYELTSHSAREVGSWELLEDTSGLVLAESYPQMSALLFSNKPLVPCTSLNSSSGLRDAGRHD